MDVQRESPIFPLLALPKDGSRTSDDILRPSATVNDTLRTDPILHGSQSTEENKDTKLEDSYLRWQYLYRLDRTADDYANGYIKTNHRVERMKNGIRSPSTTLGSVRGKYDDDYDFTTLSDVWRPFDNRCDLVVNGGRVEKTRVRLEDLLSMLSSNTENHALSTYDNTPEPSTSSTADTVSEVSSPPTDTYRTAHSQQSSYTAAHASNSAPPRPPPSHPSNLAAYLSASHSSSVIIEMSDFYPEDNLSEYSYSTDSDAERNTKPNMNTVGVCLSVAGAFLCSVPVAIIYLLLVSSVLALIGYVFLFVGKSGLEGMMRAGEVLLFSNGTRIGWGT
ncbi:hypothetical protein MMC14_002404 [Varicellaria rhodocarpa]|nr:hypothetical protein [Varicellaria rhodocarpa]